MAQITEDYVSFDIAKLLKEKGFDEPCECFYDTENNDPSIVNGWMVISNSELEKREFVCYSAPTLQMAMKWLRDIHNYSISICLDSYVEPYDNEYYILIRRKKDLFEEISPCEQVYFKTYEEAAEAAIKYCLENLI